jgi:hypothetical protein
VTATVRSPGQAAHTEGMAANKVRLRVYRRDGDRKWAWQIKVGSDIIAVDGSQGYNNREDAAAPATKLLNGDYDDYEIELEQE